MELKNGTRCIICTVCVILSVVLVLCGMPAQAMEVSQEPTSGPLEAPSGGESNEEDATSGGERNEEDTTLENAALENVEVTPGEHMTADESVPDPDAMLGEGDETADQFSPLEIIEGEEPVGTEAPAGDAATQAGEDDLVVTQSEDAVAETNDVEQRSLAIEPIETQCFTGKAIRPAVVVECDGRQLAATDYSVRYADNVNVGTATVVVTGVGTYAGLRATTTFGISAVSIRDATAQTIAKQAYTGKEVSPVPSLTFGAKKLKAGTDYTVAYANNVEPGKASVSITGTGNFRGTRKLSFKIVAPSISYKVYVQKTGAGPWVKDGARAGATGKAKRVESIRVKLASGFPIAGGVKYKAHVQGIGWQGWRSDGALAGTSGKSKRVEAVRVKLTGALAKRYDVWYRVRAQRVGWMGWARNDATSGTVGMSWRVEAVQVLLAPKGMAAPRRVAGIASKTSLTSISNPGLQLRARVRGVGWQETAGGDVVSGMPGKGKRVTGMRAALGATNLEGSIRYAAYNATNAEWTGWTTDGATCGATGTPKRMEALRIKLKGQVSTYFNVWYRTCVKGFGWLGWASNGAKAGVGRPGECLEAFEVRLVPKGAAAPGATAGAFRTWKPYSSGDKKIDVIVNDLVWKYTKTGHDKRRARILAAAYSQRGVPYGYGGAYPGVVFDCSGFTSWCYAQAGISIPHSSAEQAAMATRCAFRDLQAGDLVFWIGTGGASISGNHVAIYVGDGQVIHSNELGVNVAPLKSTWNSCGTIP